MVLFDRDYGPGRRATVVAEVRSTFKSCSQKPFLQKCSKSVGFPTKSARARGVDFWNFFLEKPLGFWCFYVKIVTKTKVLEGFRLARANVHFVSFFARDSWSLDILEHEMSFCIVFYKGKRASTKVLPLFLLKNHWVFDVFMLKSLRKLRFWKDFVPRARMCTSSHFLQGILEVWLC